ncbi:SUMF1/EgtB/PvdO family nonheme iron enzyme [Ardenticatena maritima]|uniref:SUMF1/EgtB/PvdO family nonheme iron enzyme n=2 Tax=Ardenticatena maritima TaxID=872965 RepID=UPI000761AC7C|nr:SUMF1/EgtB/PvdO family nonheme iron enzyme [Ardenticatena maritima]
MIRRFRLRLEQTNEDDILLIAFDTPAGDVVERRRAPFAPGELVRLLDELERTATVADADDLLAVQLGERLFAWLFAEQVGALWHESRAIAHAHGDALRLELYLPQAFQAWPWELLRDPEGDFLAFSSLTPVVRFVPTPHTNEPPMLVEPPLRLLAVFASPEGMPPLDVAAEEARLQTALETVSPAGMFTLHVVRNATPGMLHRAVRRFQPHVVHVAAHGDPSGRIFLQSDSGAPVAMGGREWARLLADVPTVRLLWLNSCHSADERAHVPTLAERFMELGVPAVVAMHRAISDAAAITLTQTVYEALAEGWTLESALAHGRKALAQAHGLDWSTPALYLSRANSRLWSVVGAAPQRDEVVLIEPEEATPTTPPPDLTLDVLAELEVCALPPLDAWVGPLGEERCVSVGALWVSRTPITNAHYAAFVAATGAEPPPHWGGMTPPAELRDHPVVFVARAEAEAFAAWLGGRLPTEEEWERIARGDRARIFPWGDEWCATCAHTAEQGARSTAPVGRYPDGATPEGVLDLAGNVWEWTATTEEGQAIAKGGSWFEPAEAARTWERLYADPVRGYDDVGFRVVWDEAPQETRNV